jgi:CRISPR/Cas system-associated exonuclease Cas4 (RecB family)
MLEIRTIAEFFQLSEFHRSSIIRELKTKMRLEDWLNAFNNKKKRNIPAGVSWKCKHCSGSGKIVAKPRNNNDIHPSQVSKCVKKVWLDCSGYAEQMEEFIEPRIRMLFDLGHAWHDTVQGYGARGAWGSAKDYHAEVEIDPDAKDDDGESIHPMAEAFWIRGSVDGLLDPYVVNVEGIGKVAVRVIHEYKTINSNGYSKLNRPKPDHKWQATLYSVCLDVPIVVYLYTNKDNNQMSDFPIAFDHTLMRQIEDKIEQIQHHVALGTPPPWEQTASGTNPYECSYCPYLQICKPPHKGKRR